MDLSDLIFPLLIVGSVIVQWLSSRKGEEDQSPPDLPPQHPSDSQKSDKDPSWDDLMEALGQPAAPPEVPPVVERQEPEWQPEPSPPPIPVYQAPERPAHVNLIDRQREKLAEKKRQLELVKQQSKVKLSSSSPSVTTATSHRHRATGLNLRQMLNNRKSLKQAVVLNEILQPPVSLR